MTAEAHRTFFSNPFQCGVVARFVVFEIERLAGNMVSLLPAPLVIHGVAINLFEVLADRGAAQVGDLIEYEAASRYFGWFRRVVSSGAATESAS